MNRLLLAICAVSLCVASFAAPAAAIADGPPPIAWTTPAEIVSVHDGDTLTVEVRRRFEVRLIDCWAPEVNKPAEREAGFASRDHLQSRIDARGAKAVVSIPLVERKRDGYIDPGDSTTMSRVAGWVWLHGDSKSLNEIQVESGHATLVKLKPSRN